MGNYIGPNDGEGITLYIDGEQVGSDIENYIASYSAGEGSIVVGRYYTDQDKNYASIMVDELIFFNHSLTLKEIKALATSA